MILNEQSLYLINVLNCCLCVAIYYDITETYNVLFLSLSDVEYGLCKVQLDINHTASCFISRSLGNNNVVI